MEGLSGDLKTIPLCSLILCVARKAHSTLRLFPLGPLWSLLHTWRLMGQPEGPPHMDNLVFLFSLPHLAMNPPSSRVSGHLQEQSPEVTQGGAERQGLGVGCQGSYRKDEMRG